jgi:hypothetical protein
MEFLREYETAFHVFTAGLAFAFVAAVAMRLLY